MNRNKFNKKLAQLQHDKTEHIQSCRQQALRELNNVIKQATAIMHTLLDGVPAHKVRGDLSSLREQVITTEMTARSSEQSNNILVETNRLLQE